MTCVEFESRIHELLDERLSLEQPDIQRHMAACSGCGMVYDSIRVLLQASKQHHSMLVSDDCAAS